MPRPATGVPQGIASTGQAFVLTVSHGLQVRPGRHQVATSVKVGQFLAAAGIHERCAAASIGLATGESRNSFERGKGTADTVSNFQEELLGCYLVDVGPLLEQGM